MSFPFPVVTPSVAVPAVTQGTVLNQIITTDGTSFAFTGLTSGITADAYPIIGIMARSGSAPDFASFDVGGQTCTQLYKQLNGTTVLAFYSAPRGATGNVNVTFNVTMVRAACCVIPLFNLKSNTTPTEVNTNASDPMNAAISCDAGGWIGGLAYNGSAADSMAWTNLTERFDVQPESVSCFSGACDVFASAQASRSITANPANAGSGQIMILMALR
ncbi:hypothetical protein [Mesorhizobium sp.]|uniref:hypothetical protein n=1 Tax=Mesorhizobium sp. TaxID=1871066 RepID=UPI000FE792A3|nr:hypothetical protein [Mesorhizobium sp.]RWF68558.1 MAG: hypothetical protein EOQ34_25095 [Mesorhizobium sp.]TIN03886.1 MAG: hypothetical protein E5Y38_06400 [Mesorhizobium sp.]TIQ95481.1 MAG: hypothetical protein E5X36_21785 [Mesorhizobium sp.]